MIIFLQYKYVLRYGLAYETEKEQFGKLLETFKQEEIEF
jgi:hypothetical protein